MTQFTGQTDRALVVDTATRFAALTGCVGEYLRLCKMRLTLMVVITTAIGFGMGLGDLGAQWSWVALLAAVLGTGMCCSGAGVFNQIYERHTDAVMQRTMRRPLPAGSIRPRDALVFASVLVAAGLAVLVVLTHWLTAALALLSVISYAMIYTPLKRRSSASTIVGAVPGALPPVIGYSAATGRLSIEACLLFALVFVWQLPHFWAIAWLYRKDYARAGLPILSVLDRDGSRTFRGILLGCLALVPLGLMPIVVEMSGLLYGVGATMAGLIFLGFAVALRIGKTRQHARAMFFASLVYLPTVLTLMLIDRI